MESNECECCGFLNPVGGLQEREPDTAGISSWTGRRMKVCQFCLKAKFAIGVDAVSYHSNAYNILLKEIRTHREASGE